MTDLVEMWSFEELLDHAYEIFLELAVDNLNQADIDRFNAEFDDAGVLEHIAPDESWNEIVGFDVDPELYSEITVGLENEAGDMTFVFCKILICNLKEDRFCHVQWR